MRHEWVVREQADGARPIQGRESGARAARRGWEVLREQLAEDRDGIVWDALGEDKRVGVGTRALRVGEHGCMEVRIAGDLGEGGPQRETKDRKGDSKGGIGIVLFGETVKDGRAEDNLQQLGARVLPAVPHKITKRKA